MENISDKTTVIIGFVAILVFATCSITRVIIVQKEVWAEDKPQMINGVPTWTPKPYPQKRQEQQSNIKIDTCTITYLPDHLKEGMKVSGRYVTFSNGMTCYLGGWKSGVSAQNRIDFNYFTQNRLSKFQVVSEKVGFPSFWRFKSAIAIN